MRPIKVTAPARPEAVAAVAVNPRIRLGCAMILPDVGGEVGRFL